MTARWVMFCEARGDFRTASGLVDRVLRARGAAWLRDLLDGFPETVRAWADQRPVALR
jgi:hypothetical protein